MIRNAAILGSLLASSLFLSGCVGNTYGFSCLLPGNGWNTWTPTQAELVLIDRHLLKGEQARCFRQRDDGTKELIATKSGTRGHAVFEFRFVGDGIEILDDGMVFVGS